MSERQGNQGGRPEGAPNVARGFSYDEPLIFEHSRPGRVGFSLADCDVPELPATTRCLGSPIPAP